MWKRGDIGMVQLKQRLINSVRHALCDVLIEYYLLTASFSYIPDRYLKLSCKNSRHIKPHKPATAVAIYRHTASAGPVGCGGKRSPQPPRTFRSLSSSPVWYVPPPFGVSKAEPPEILTTPPTLERKPSGQADGTFNCPNGDDDNKEFIIGNPVRLSSSSVDSKQCRSHSEGGVLSKNAAQFKPIGRSHSNPTPPVCYPGDGNDKPKSGKRSSYETFSENELTESRKLGDEAVIENSGYIAKKGPKKATDSDQDSQVKERENEDFREERMKYENGELGTLHPRYDSLHAFNRHSLNVRTLGKSLCKI